MVGAARGEGRDSKASCMQGRDYYGKGWDVFAQQHRGQRPLYYLCKSYTFVE